jgi:hypothetical protein
MPAPETTITRLDLTTADESENKAFLVLMLVDSASRESVMVMLGGVYCYRSRVQHASASARDFAFFFA